jgi:Fe-S-cluster containining protein
MWFPTRQQVQEQHQILDGEIAGWLADYRTRGGMIFCGQGCRNCCSLAVNCTFPEALNMAGTLTQAQAEAVRSHVVRLRQALPQLTDLKSFLKLHRQQLGYCPLLDAAGSCGRYESRPASCRALLSTKEHHWCAADFSALAGEEKRAYLESLDRDVVSFPVHYVAPTQDLGQELEARLIRTMGASLGFSLYGNLPVLLFLELDHRLSSALPRGYEATVSLVEQTGLLHPFLIMPSR